MPIAKIIKLGGFTISNAAPLVLIAGPCQLESAELAMHVASEVANIAAKMDIPFVFKSSFDKANRTSMNGARGMSLDEAMPIFRAIKEKIGCPILTDVHLPEQCKAVAEVADILQIPAFLCRQTDLLLAAGRTGKVVNVKKGQFMAPWNMAAVAEKVASTGNDRIMLTDRGVSFGYNTLVSDMRALPTMADTGYPVVFDATHSVQQPGSMGGQSGGERRFVRPLARAAVAVGVAAVFLEVHPDPASAPSDGACMLELHQLANVLSELKAIDQIAKQFNRAQAI